MFFTPDEESKINADIHDFSDEITICLDSGLSFPEALAAYFVKQHDYGKAYIAFQYALEITPNSSYAQQSFNELTELRNKIASSPFFGKKYVITGSLCNDIERETALNLIKFFGGKTSDSPVNDMDVLVVGYCEWSELNNGKPTRKIQKAIDLQNKGRDVKIISDVDFIRDLASFAKDILSDESYSYFFSDII